MANWTNTFTYYEGEWREGNTPIMGPRDHAAWLGSSVFDGGRSFEGMTPDLDLHCARVNVSAREMNLKPIYSDQEILDLALEGIKLFPSDMALYIRPMYWAEEGGYMAVAPNPDSTKFCMCIYETPMPPADAGFSITGSIYQKPSPKSALSGAKAGCLYPNNGRALLEARDKGFDNCLLLDPDGNIAELATANVFLVKDGVVKTPSANGTFLSGITRARVIKLLEEAGETVSETTLSFDDFMTADEIFSTGNYSKVSAITRIETREIPHGPIAKKARQLYWDWAKATTNL